MLPVLDQLLPFVQGTNNSILLSTVVAVIALGLWSLQSKKPRDPREPPIFASTIPVVGHLLNLIIYQAEYIKQLASQKTWPIFTLKIFSGEIYVVTSPELMQAIFKNPKVFSFDEISIEASAKIFGFTKRQMDILSRPKEGSTDKYPLAKEITHLMHTTMISGRPLLQMNSRALNRFAKFVNPIGPKGLEVTLYEWLRHTFTLATMEALYGPINPFSEDESLIYTLQEFENAMGPLFLNFYPEYTARSGHKARKSIAAAFKKYYDGKHNFNASAIIKGRYDSQLRGGFNTDDMASFDIGLCIASTMNSIPAIFWYLVQIYSSPTLLESLRAEVETAATRNGNEAIINVTLLTKNCPLLTSTWQEMLRSTTATVLARTVTEDTTIDTNDGTQYLLKKGGHIEIACARMHLSPSIWGENSLTFTPERFTPPSIQTLSKSEKKERKMAYAPFGGGVNYCPGRYFSSNEIMGVVATMVLGFEAKSEYGVALNVPPKKAQGMGVQVLHPVGDLDVTISRREGWEGVQFGFDVGGVEGEGEGVGLAFD